MLSKGLPRTHSEGLKSGQSMRLSFMQAYFSTDGKEPTLTERSSKILRRQLMQSSTRSCPLPRLHKPVSSRALPSRKASIKGLHLHLLAILVGMFNSVESAIGKKFLQSLGTWQAKERIAALVNRLRGSLGVVEAEKEEGSSGRYVRSSLQGQT